MVIDKNTKLPDDPTWTVQDLIDTFGIYALSDGDSVSYYVPVGEPENFTIIDDAPDYTYQQTKATLGEAPVMFGIALRLGDTYTEDRFPAYILCWYCDAWDIENLDALQEASEAEEEGEIEHLVVFPEFSNPSIDPAREPFLPDSEDLIKGIVRDCAINYHPYYIVNVKKRELLGNKLPRFLLLPQLRNPPIL